MASRNAFTILRYSKYSFCQLTSRFVDYRIYFSFQFGTNDLSVILRLNGTLDYETQKSFRLVIRAYDGQGRFGDLVLNIAIEDANDVLPQFDFSRYSANIAENATIGKSKALSRLSKCLSLSY